MRIPSFLLVVLSCGTIAFGQSVALSIGSGSGTAEGTVSLSLNLASSGGAQPEGLQWSFAYSEDILSVSVSLGASGTNAQKSISCSGTVCIVYGLDNTAIADGTVAVATFQLAANPASATIPIQITSVVGVDISASSIPASGNIGAIVVVQPPPPAPPVTLNGLSCATATFNGAGNTLCTISLSSAAASGGFSVTLSSNNANVTVPSSVLIAAGQSTAQFTATVIQVSADQTGVVAASADGVIENVTMNLLAPIKLTSLTCPPISPGSNTSTTCTVSLNKSSPNAAVVSLGSSSGLVTVPGTVTILAGQSSAAFSATTGTVTSNQNVTVTATLNGQSQAVTLTVQPIPLTCVSTTIDTPGVATCTVTLPAPAPPSGATIALLSNNGAVTVPASVTVAAGNNTAQFSATAAPVTTDQAAVVTASTSGITQTVTLNLFTALLPNSLTCQTTTLTANASSLCTVSLNRAAASAAVVTLTRTNGAITVPLSATVPTGQSSGTFLVTTAVVNSSQVTVWATLNNQTKSTVITLTTIQFSAFSCSLTKVKAGAWASTCTITLAGKAPSGGWTVALSSSNSIITVPPSVTVPAGASSASFAPKVASLSSIPATVITATLNGASKTATLSAAATTTQSGSPVTSSARTSKPANKPGPLTSHIAGLYNAASYLPEQTCSPGSMATLVGSGFTGSDPQQAAAGPWPTQLAGLRVTANDNVDLPISAVTDTLIQFQCPALPAQTPVSITVGSSQFTESLKFTLQEATPGVYVLDNANQGAVLVAGTNQVAMATTDARPSRPARKGEYLSIYANGLGPLQQDVPLGTPAPLDSAIQTTDPVVVVVGAVELPASFSGLAPGATGVYQVNVQLSPDVPTGNAVPFYLKVVLRDGTVVQSNIATVAITQ